MFFNEIIIFQELEKPRYWIISLPNSTANESLSFSTNLVRVLLWNPLWPSETLVNCLRNGWNSAMDASAAPSKTSASTLWNNWWNDEATSITSSSRRQVSPTPVGALHDWEAKTVCLRDLSKRVMLVLKVRLFVPCPGVRFGVAFLHSCDLIGSYFYFNFESFFYNVGNWRRKLKITPLLLR